MLFIKTYLNKYILFQNQPNNTITEKYFQVLNKERARKQFFPKATPYLHDSLQNFKLKKKTKNYITPLLLSLLISQCAVAPTMPMLMKAGKKEKLKK